MDRRVFVTTMAGGLLAACTTLSKKGPLPGGKVVTSPNDRLNIAAVGIGGMGAHNVKVVGESENIVALCDVDSKYAAKTFAKYPKAEKYQDYRVMLEKQKDIDAVIIATPDHTHAIIAMAAMQLGKHVYVQKPLTRTVYESRVLAEAARKYKVATQMGNQGRSGEGIRLITEWIEDGAIGEVREVYTWTNRPIWPQGLKRPRKTPRVPRHLDWDLFLGPAPYRPYHPEYHPWNWRAWWDFGTGALGDMACHIIDPVFMALKLGYPTKVEASSTPVNNESAPHASIVRYTFPAREGKPPVRLTWWDGGMMPPRPEELEPGRRMGDESGGVLFIGSKGKLMCGCYAKNPRLISEAKMKAYKRPAKTIPRVEVPHEMDWVLACKGERPACSDFDYSGPLSEVVLMGNLAIRTGKQLEWDGENMKVTNNVPEANQYVNPPYREGWKLK
ncbi:MAG: Gfo/Idh/MocA family oxidoreductase [Candidatus Aminicenantes bacterium]|nr:Gfo/Idh/MocA family oxidoreductase [Candidatus Aminicenantes bacterium]